MPQQCRSITLPSRTLVARRYQVLLRFPNRVRAEGLCENQCCQDMGPILGQTEGYFKPENRIGLGFDDRLRQTSSRQSHRRTMVKEKLIR